MARYRRDDAEALLLIGVWTKEVVFRRLGILAALLVSGQMISVEAARVFGRRMDGADLRPDFALSIIFVVAAAAFYINEHWVLRRWADRFKEEVDRRVMERLSYAGCGMGFRMARISGIVDSCGLVRAWIGIGSGSFEISSLSAGCGWDERCEG